MEFVTCAAVSCLGIHSDHPLYSSNRAGPCAPQGYNNSGLYNMRGAGRPGMSMHLWFGCPGQVKSPGRIYGRVLGLNYDIYTFRGTFISIRNNNIISNSLRNDS